jgi:hypothetical protein
MAVLHVGSLIVDNSTTGGGSNATTYALAPAASSTTLGTWSYPGQLANYGSYFLIAYNVLQGGASAQWHIAKTLASGISFSSFRVVSCQGSYGEELDVIWPANSLPYIINSSVGSGTVGGIPSTTTATYNIRYVNY